MEITAIGSSSSGNCYLLQSEQGGLLLECGLPIKKIRAALPVSISSLDGCLISHEHGDHAEAVEELLKAAVDCYMTKGTAEALGVAKHHRVHIIEAGKITRIGEWTVLPFSIIHDAVEPVGFILQRGGERVLYATDTRYLNVTVAGINYLMVECNYVLDIIKKNSSEGIIPRSVKNRVLRTHMGLDTLKKYFEKLIEMGFLESVRQIWLLHLSDLNSDENLIIENVQRITGKEVIVA